MHYQSEFQSDSFQDRRAARTGQEWVELETRPFGALRARYSEGSTLVMSLVSSLPSEYRVYTRVY